MQLVTRSPSGSVPTDAGVVVAGWAEAILRSAHELKAGLEAFQAEQVGRLRVTASFTVAEYLLPQWLGRFAREHPGDSVALEVANSTSVIQRVHDGSADLGFIETTSPVPDLEEQVVGTDELIAVVARTHPWAKRGSVPVEALAATPLVTREAGSGTREAFEAALAELDLGTPTAVLELGSTSAVRSAVIDGNSPTVISRLAVADELSNGSLVEIQVSDLQISRVLRAVWSKRHPLPPRCSHQIMMDGLRASTPDKPTRHPPTIAAVAPDPHDRLRTAPNIKLQIAAMIGHPKMSAST